MICFLMTHLFAPAFSSSPVSVKIDTDNSPVTVSCAVPINLAATLTDTAGVFSRTGAVDSVTKYYIRVHNTSGGTV